MIKFPSIGQFRDAIKQIQSSAKYHGKPVPKLKMVGFTKVHGCFSSNTLVTMATGDQKKISDIEVGDSILSYDTNAGTQTVKKVMTVFDKVKLEKEWVRLHFNDRVIECTADHKFWTSTRGWVEAQNLKPTDIFVIDA
jgi:hypothetical protein